MRSDWREWVVAEARSWKGTPYIHRGRVKGVGVDCGALLYEVYGQLVQLKPFPREYAPDWAMHKENEIYLGFLQPYVVEVPRPVPGGVSVFQYGRNFSHAGIVTEKKTFVHAWGRNQFGCVREDKIGFFMIGEKRRKVKHFDMSVTT
jgi:NlpC/P60 family putative phage cell wall peptidase